MERLRLLLTFGCLAAMLGVFCCGCTAPTKKAAPQYNAYLERRTSIQAPRPQYRQGPRLYDLSSVG